MELLRDEKPFCNRAFSEIYRRYGSKLNAYCRTRLCSASAADDIFQNTWIKFNNAVKHGTEIRNLQAFLITIARNLCNDKFKEQKQISEMFIDIDNNASEEWSYSYNPESTFEDEELLNIITIGLNSLEDIYKDAFILNKIIGLSYQEIGDMQGETSECIKKRITRALIMIKKVLKPYIDELSQ